MSDQPLLQTKLYQPQPPAGLVTRPRLLAQLGRDPRPRLVLVSAPAGYGKTTLITNWLAEQSAPVCWLSLDEEDAEPATFFAYVAAALAPLPQRQSMLAQLLLATQPSSAKRLMQALINDVASVTKPFVLVLDDYHTIDSAEIDDALAYLLDHLPPTMTLAMTTRHDPGFPLARLRVRRQLVELRAADLRFTTDEAAAFLQQTMGLTLSAEQIGTLEARTEGWIAGLQLAALSMQHRDDIDGFLHSFSGSHRFVMDYLAEEVLRQHSAEMQQFLLRTALFERINPDLCDAILGRSDSRERLREIEARNLFLVPLDDQRYWFRYHHLFADFFRIRLAATEPDQLPTLHLAAAHWFAQAGLLDKALDHALLADEVELAAAWVKESSADLMRRGGVVLLKQRLDKLPSARIQHDLMLAMLQGWAETTLFDSESGRVPNYDGLLALIANAGLPPEASAEIEGEVLAMRTIHAMNGARPEQAKRFGEQALAKLPSDAIVLQHVVQLQFANAARFEGDFAQAADHYRGIVADGLQASDALSYFLAYALLAGLERLCGRPLAAQKLVAQAAAEHERLPEPTPLLGVVLVQAALAQFELGQVDAALDTVAEAMPLSEHMGQLETSAELHHVRARALALRGEGKAAREAQATAELLLQANVPPDWRGMAEVMALRFARLTDDSTAMRQALVLAQDAHPPLAELGLMLRLERALAHLALGEPAEAQRVVADWPTSLDDAMPVLALAATLAQGAAMLAQNRASEALAALETALISAERHGCVAPFFESGEAVQALVAELGVRVDPALKEAVARVQAISAEVLPSSPQQALIDPLSDRELEILRLIATGLKNKEISAELVISLNTVFYHTKNIYAKLGVHSRSQAIAKATDLNLL